MSAVKRVQKLLHQAEKRAMANVKLDDARTSEKDKLAQLAKVGERREEVFVKATGKAIERALNVGKWFEEKEDEFVVRVNTGSVLVVDDVVVDEERKERELKKGDSRSGEKGGDGEAGTEQSASKDSKKRKREVPAVSEEVELPESRTRWIKMVEVAVSLK